MGENLIIEVVRGAPNFIGFLLALIILWQAYRQLLDVHKRVIEALITRENCDDE